MPNDPEIPVTPTMIPEGISRAVLSEDEKLDIFLKLILISELLTALAFILFSIPFPAMLSSDSLIAIIQ